MAIKIPVSAQFDAADLKQQIQMVNDQIRILASQVGQANKQKFEPINVKSKEDLDAFIKQMQKLLKIQTELATTMQKTGQGAKNPLMADWKKMYGDQATRIKKMQEMLQFMGVEFDDLPASKGPKPKPPAPAPTPTPNVPARPGGGIDWRNGWGGQGVNVLSSGLNAIGPVGGVFSGALRSGLSGGAGAGLMGLVGGLAAMGVGKLIGAVADKIEKAQDAAIGMDKIYRQIGGIASYNAIKSTAYGVGNRLGMDVGESIGLASTYARSSNLRDGDNLATGMLVSGGMARHYGMEPNSVAGMMGGFRSSNIARNDKDLKQIGLVIGETIAKSNAFGKADEMMQSISQYSQAQARQALVAPNVGAYGGAMTSLMSANIPGLDVAGSAALLNRVNGALTGGGAMGDASQFFTSRVAQANGMNPFQMRMMREGGMFATKDQMFGQGSMYAGAFGSGPGGDQSYFSMTRDQLRRNYGASTPDYYLAMANHMGIGVNQAVALDKMDTSTISGASSRLSSMGLDLTKINPESLGTIGQIESGRGLAGLAQGYLNMSGDKALSKDEHDKLLSAYQGSDPDKLKNALMEVAAKRGNVETDGSKIRDAVAQLDNNFTQYADKALPALNVMRMALVKMSGGTEDKLRKDYYESETSAREKEITGRYGAQRRELSAKRNLVTGTPREIIEKQGAIDKQIDALDQAQDKELNDMSSQVREQIYGKSSAVEGAAAAGGGYGNSPAAQMADIMATQGDSSVASSGPLSGFNVGNIRNASGNGFRRYGSAREGVEGMAGQLLRYQSGKFDGKQRSTLRQLISTYAPPNENRTGEYISQISQWTGINPDTPIDLRDPAIMQKVMTAMIRKENGEKGLNAASGHLSEGIGDAMRNSRNFTPGYQNSSSEVRIAVDVNGPWGTQTANHTHKVNPSFQQPNSWNNR